MESQGCAVFAMKGRPHNLLWGSSRPISSCCGIHFVAVCGQEKKNSPMKKVD
jgi:hypothetical protein